jgi:hypothetical protein
MQLLHKRFFAKKLLQLPSEIVQLLGMVRLAQKYCKTEIKQLPPEMIDIN